jgi:hypothetical protein
MKIRVGDPLLYVREDKIKVPVFASSNDFDQKVTFSHDGATITAPVSQVENLAGSVTGHVADFTNGRPKCPKCDGPMHFVNAQVDPQSRVARGRFECSECVTDQKTQRHLDWFIDVRPPKQTNRAPAPANPQSFRPTKVKTTKGPKGARGPKGPKGPSGPKSRTKRK